jgi:hypothetical protein
MTKQYHLPVGYAACRFRWGGDALEEEASFTLHVATTGLTPEQISGAAQTAAYEHLLNFGTSMSNSYNFRGVDVSLSTIEGEPIITEGTLNITGGSAGPVVPPNCALLVSKVTGVGGRRNRGRVYYPPVTLNEDQVSNSGTITPATLLLYQADWDAFLAELELSNIPPVVAHQYDPDLGETALTPTPMISFVVSGRIATQRRRLR